jgi:hypothetical protein
MRSSLPKSWSIRFMASALLLLAGAPNPAARQRPPATAAEPTAGDPAFVDLAGATVVVPASGSVQERTAARMLVE